jgi:hypothetical protein
VAVEVEGRYDMSASRVVAEDLKCINGQAGSLTRTLEGRIVSLDASARRLSLAAGGQTTAVRWTDTTLFAGLKTTDLAVGMALEVDGHLPAAGDMVATKVKRD